MQIPVIFNALSHENLQLGKKLQLCHFQQCDSQISLFFQSILLEKPFNPVALNKTGLIRSDSRAKSFIVK